MAAEKNGKHLRQYPRIATPTGVWVAWQQEARKQVCRVRDLNVGGLFVSTQDPAPVGAVISVLFSVAEGEIRGHATVRNVKVGEGMGVQFTAMGVQDTERFRKLLARLLEATTSTPA